MDVTEAKLLELSGEHDISEVQALVLRDYQISKIQKSVISRLSRLNCLSLSNNLITTIDFLESLDGLVELNLNFNQISDVGSLNCLGLKKLFLSHNLLSDFDSLSHLTNIRELCLYENKIDNIAEGGFRPLINMRKLHSLDVGGNGAFSSPSSTTLLVSVDSKIVVNSLFQ